MTRVRPMGALTPSRSLMFSQAGRGKGQGAEKRCTMGRS